MKTKINDHVNENNQDALDLSSGQDLKELSLEDQIRSFAQIIVDQLIKKDDE